MSESNFSLLGQLPDVVLDNLFKFLNFEEVSMLRLVNKRLDIAAGMRLNQGFREVERYHARLMKRFKSRLPRRESERRNHPLIKHCDILTAIETRISLLGMTFMKYVDAKMCCFIPGKVIDEIYRVLARIRTDSNPPKAYEMLQELRDISSMAMEYFDEQIVPMLKPNPENALCHLTSPTGKYIHGFGVASNMMPPGLSTPSTSGSSPCVPFTSLGLGDTVQHLRRRVKLLEKKQKKNYEDSSKTIREFKQTVSDQNVKITNLELVVNTQRALLTSQSEALKATEAKIAELSRRLSDNEDKMRGLQQKSPTAVTYVETNQSCMSARHQKKRKSIKSLPQEAESSMDVKRPKN